MAAKFDILQASIRAEFHFQIDLIATCGIIAADSHSSVGQLPKFRGRRE